MFVAGAYVMTLGGTSVGQLELDSLHINFTEASEDIVGDNFGEGVQDGVYRGGNCYVDFVCLEHDAILSAMSSYPAFATPGLVGNIGYLKSQYAKIMVLTRVGPSTTNPPTATYTAGRSGPLGGAVLPRGFPVDHLLAPRLRRMPMRLQLLPYTVSTVKYWFEIA